MATTVQDRSVYGPQRITKGRKDVVTAFLQRQTDGAIAVLQRSEKVGSYQLKWGGVSGIVEGDEAIIERSFLEISEELQIPREAVEFVRSGRPLYVDDAHRKFAVHPMLFRLVAPSDDATSAIEPQLNWENIAFKWIQPEELSSLDHVPMLPETWDRLSLTERQEAALERLKDDRVHGAAKLAKIALEEFQEEYNEYCSIKKPDYGEGQSILDALRNWGYQLATCRPSMAPLANTIAETLAVVHYELHARAEAFEASGGEVCFALNKAVTEESQRLTSIADSLCQHAIEVLYNDGDMTIMTISYSSSVVEAIKAAAAGTTSTNRKLRVIACESRPLYEGVVLAQELAAAGIETTIITDAQAAVFIKKANLVLVGSDAVTENAVVNKVGTHLLALAAQQQGVPVYAVADTTKISPGSLFSIAHPGGDDEFSKHEEKPASEITSTWKAEQQLAKRSSRIRNVYFEDIPLTLFAGVVTERGILEPREVKDEVARLDKLNRLAFQLD